MGEKGRPPEAKTLSLILLQQGSGLRVERGQSAVPYQVASLRPEIPSTAGKLKRAPDRYLPGGLPQGLPGLLRA